MLVALAVGGCQDLNVPRGQRTVRDPESGLTATFPGEGRICRGVGWGHLIGLSMELDGGKRDCGAPKDVPHPEMVVVYWHDVEDADLERVVRAIRPCMPEPAEDLSGLEFAGHRSFICEETGTDGLPIIQVFTMTRQMEGIGPLHSLYVATLLTTPRRRAADLRLFRALLANVVFDAGPVDVTTEPRAGAPAALT